MSVAMPLAPFSNSSVGVTPRRTACYRAYRGLGAAPSGAGRMGNAALAINMPPRWGFGDRTGNMGKATVYQCLSIQPLQGWME